MKYYLIDEISGRDMERLSRYLKDSRKMSGLDKLFWIEVPEEFLNDVQAGHGTCRPYFFSLETGAGMIKTELFIRTLKGMKCTCSSYADERQTRFITGFVDGIIRNLDIRT